MFPPLGSGKEGPFSPFLSPFLSGLDPYTAPSYTPPLAPQHNQTTNDFSLDELLYASPAITPVFSPVAPSQLLMIDNHIRTDNPKIRRSVHKDAEQKRRDILKNAFDQLRTTLLVPSDLTISKVAVLNKCTKH
jgi:hypothetical protein